MEPENNRQRRHDRRQSLSKYARYSAFAFQMIGIFLLLSLGGNWLDKKMEYGFPYFTLGGVLLALVSIFYTLYTLVSNNNND